MRSRNPQDIIEEVEHLARNSFKEIVLSGIHVASYGKDLKNTDFLEIIKRVHEIDGIERIRFSSVEPGIINRDFVNNIKNMDKICRHIHLSLQSGCDRTLLRMNRKYNVYDYEKSVYLLRESFQNFAVTTDIIVGFPGETDEDFLDSLNFCGKIELSKIHIFPFSPKKGTAAFKMPDQISTETKNKRKDIFSKLDKDLQLRFLTKNLNTKSNVLFEKKCDDNLYEGHTDNYILVRTNSADELVNKIKTVKLNKIKNLIMEADLEER